MGFAANKSMFCMFYLIFFVFVLCCELYVCTSHAINKLKMLVLLAFFPLVFCGAFVRKMHVATCMFGPVKMTCEYALIFFKPNYARAYRNDACTE